MIDMEYEKWNMKNGEDIKDACLKTHISYFIFHISPEAGVYA